MKKENISEADVFMSFFWQQASTEIVNWTARRHTAFFAGISTTVGIIAAYLFSSLLIAVYDLRLARINVWLILFILFFSIIIYWNAKHALKEALQMVDYWFADRFNQEFNEINGSILRKMT